MPRYIIYKILAFLRLCREFSEEMNPNCLIGKVQLAMLATSVVENVYGRGPYLAREVDILSFFRY